MKGPSAEPFNFVAKGAYDRDLSECANVYTLCFVQVSVVAVSRSLT